MTSSAKAGISTQEGKTITFTVTPSGIVSAQTVLNLNMVGSALGAITNTTSAADFTAASTLVFAAGDTAAKTVTVTVVNDGTTEGLEAYKAQLLDSSYNEKAAIQGTVTDATPTVTLAASAASVNEGAALTFTATSDMVAPAGGLVVPVTFGGTAVAADYTTSATSITIAAGATTGSLTLNAIADNATEGAETVTASLGNVNGATTVTTAVSATINDTSLALAANAFSLSGAATANEGTSVVYTITRGAAATVATTVPYTITGSATSGADYTAQTGSASFAIGATTATITLPITADLLTEGNETVIVTLGTPSVSTDVVSTGAGTVTTTIADTSTTPVVSAFTLTASGNTSTNGVDNVTGSAYNAINGLIDASTGSASSTASTWNLTDSIAPSASAAASMNLTLLGRSDAATAVSLAGYGTTNVPTFNLKVLDTTAAFSNSTSWDVGSQAGLTTVNVANSTTISTSTNADTVTLTSLPVGAKLGVNTNGQYTNVTSTWVTAATSGSADTVNLALEGRNGTITIGTGFETAAIVTAGSTANRQAALNSQTTATMKTVTVAGTALRVDTALDSTITSFDATNASGIIDVALTPGSTFTAKGGAGSTDVIQLAAAGSTPTISGFEKVVAGGAIGVDFTNITGATVAAVAANAGAVTFTNVPATTSTLNFSGSSNTTRTTDVAATGNLGTGGTVGYTLKTATGSSDTLAVTVDNGGTTTAGTYTVGGLLTATAEIINLSVADWKAFTVTTGITQTVTAAAASSLTVSATSANLTLGQLTSTDLTGGVTYNFSAVAPTTAAPTTTGAVSATTMAATGTLTYTGSQGVDTVANTTQTSTTTTKTQTFNLGAGNDLMTVSIDNLVTGVGTSVTDKLVVNGEAGDDTFTISDQATRTNSGAVTIDGGAGTNDALVLTGTNLLGPTATIAGIEKINFQTTATGVTTALTVAAGYSDSVLLTDVSTGGNQTLNITSAGNVDVSGWTQLGWTNSAIGAPADVLSVTGSGIIKGSAVIATAVTGGASADTITTAGAAATVTGAGGIDTITLGSANAQPDSVVISAIVAAADRDVVNNFVTTSDKLTLGLANTTVATGAGAAVVATSTTAAGVGGGAIAIATASSSTKDVVILTVTAAGVNSGDLSASTNGTELLKALTDATAADTYTAITASTAADKCYFAATQGGNTYVYYADSSADGTTASFSAADIILVGTFNSATLVAGDYVLA